MIVVIVNVSEIVNVMGIDVRDPIRDLDPVHMQKRVTKTEIEAVIEVKEIVAIVMIGITNKMIKDDLPKEELINVIAIESPKNLLM